MSTIMGVIHNDVKSGSSYTDIGGNYKKTPWYISLTGLAKRVYSPAYKGCSMAEEWHTASNFKEWFDEHYIEGYELDKDILIPGNKHYSPETCVFVPKQVNTFLKRGNTDGKNIQGVHFFNRTGRWVAKSGRIYGGYFDTEYEAFESYMKAKRELVPVLVKEYSLSAEIEAGINTNLDAIELEGYEFLSDKYTLAA